MNPSAHPNLTPYGRRLMAEARKHLSAGNVREARIAYALAQQFRKHTP